MRLSLLIALVWAAPAAVCCHLRWSGLVLVGRGCSCCHLLSLASLPQLQLLGLGWSELLLLLFGVRCSGLAKSDLGWSPPYPRIAESSNPRILDFQIMMNQKLTIQELIIICGIARPKDPWLVWAGLVPFLCFA